MGGAVAGPLGASVGLGVGVLSNPGVKAKFALLLNDLQKSGVKLSPTATQFRNLIGISERSQDAENN